VLLCEAFRHASLIRRVAPDGDMRAFAMRSALLRILLVSLLFAPRVAAAESASNGVKRGAYLFAIAGCAACHTDSKNKGPLLAGGRAIETPFGTFYGPNITPDPNFGIGRWSDADFVRALREGLSPTGAHLFPVFPYTSFTLITDSDLLDLKAYIFSLPPAPLPSRPHDLWFPFSWRWLQTFWRWLNFSPGPYIPDPARSASWNRGAYLVLALGHCAECHTPRGALGGLESDRALSGNPSGPERQKVPNITSDKTTGIGNWSHNQIVTLLRSGFLPNGDTVGSVMGEVIRSGTSKMTDGDRDAVASYLESLSPISNPAEKATQPGFD
jgi:mono/diheme cytochrome c family protein